MGSYAKSTWAFGYYEPGTVRIVGGNTEEVFSMCKAHECDPKHFVIFFSQMATLLKAF